MANVYGISLGSAYVALAKLGMTGFPEIVPDPELSTDLTASVVYFYDDGTVLIGDAAKEEGAIDPERRIQYFMRWIGCDTDSNRDRYIVDGRGYDPIELCTMVLGYIVNQARKSYEDVKDVVITCPVHFDAAKRNAIRQAGNAAGLNVLSVISDPIAATINYCFHHTDEDQTVLVYDLGGCSFDVTLMKVRKAESSPAFEVPGIEGNSFLGGCDWDEELYTLLLAKYEEQYGTPVEDIPEELKQIIRGEAEGCKIKLSRKEKAKIKIPFEGENVVLEVTREEFESATADYVEQTISWMNSVLQNANMTDDDVDVVLMVGGSTRMPMIHNMLTERFGDKVCFDDPDKAIAKGAAIVGGRLGNEHASLKGKRFGDFKRKSLRERLIEQLENGTASLVYDGDNKIRIVYENKPEHPLITRVTEEVRSSLNSLLANHERIEKLRNSLTGAFYDSTHTVALSRELNELIKTQKHIEQIFNAMDPWPHVMKGLASQPAKETERKWDADLSDEMSKELEDIIIRALGEQLK